MRHIILYLWQLPQNLIGWFVSFFCEKTNYGYYRWHYKCGCSLGNYIMMNSSIELKHEKGHQKQSQLLGPFYLIVIGLPSLVGNIVHRFIKFDYYKQPWEAWADELGNVKRKM